VQAKSDRRPPQRLPEKEIEVAIASRQPVEALAPVAKAVGPTVAPKALRDAVKAETIFLAVPFEIYKEVAKVTQRWQDKMVIDVTNAYGVPPEKLGKRRLDIDMAL
jgi:8-hydroxy-5-deazaflavin:NADPH oxidoreductase